MFKREIALSFDFGYYAKPRIPIVKWDKLGRKWDELLAGQVQGDWKICQCGRLGLSCRSIAHFMVNVPSAKLTSLSKLS